MKSILEELKNNFEVVQKSTKEDYFQLHTDWFDTHDKAVNGMIKLLKDEGYTKIVLPYLPIPYICDDREGNHRGTIPIVKE